MLGISPILSSTNIFAASSNLPGGTSIEVTIDDPSNGQVFQLVGAGVDVNVLGTADIGMGTPVKDTTVVYIIDRSGSMGISAGVDCDGIAGNDNRMTCAIEAVKAANQAAADPLSSVDETGAGQFSSSSAPLDVDLTAPGTQLIVAPDFDSADANATPDLEDAVSTLFASGGTNFFAGLTTAATILAASTNTNQIVIFISDGISFLGPNVNTFNTNTLPVNTIIQSFAIGTGVSCSTDSGSGSLDDVAALTPGGSCTQITNFADLANAITQSIGSTLTDLEIDVDNTGGVAADSVIPLLPQNGPTMVDYAHLATSLGAGSHDICATAFGTDAGGAGSVEECVTILVNTPPDCSSVTANADTLFPPNHKLVDVTLSGATDADGDAVTLTVTGVLQDEPTNGLGDGDQSPDAFINGDTVQLRAERSGNGDIKDADGRIYQIAFSVEDTNGGMCTGSVTVGVPHDKKDTPINSGLDFDSTQP